MLTSKPFFLLLQVEPYNHSCSTGIKFYEHEPGHLLTLRLLSVCSAPLTPDEQGITLTPTHWVFPQKSTIGHSVTGQILEGVKQHNNHFSELLNIAHVPVAPPSGCLDGL